MPVKIDLYGARSRSAIGPVSWVYIYVGSNGSREIANIKEKMIKLKNENSAIIQMNKMFIKENAEIKSRLDQQNKELAEIKRKIGL